VVGEQDGRSSASSCGGSSSDASMTARSSSVTLTRAVKLPLTAVHQRPDVTPVGQSKITSKRTSNMSASKPTPMYMDRSWFGLRKYNGRRPQWDSPEGGCYVRNISGADAKFRDVGATRVTSAPAIGSAGRPCGRAEPSEAAHWSGPLGSALAPAALASLLGSQSSGGQRRSESVRTPVKH
jgi:hypothetical protein